MLSQQIKTNYSLLKLNTFGLPCIARQYIQLKDISSLAETVRYVKANELDFMVLGGGSNVLFPPVYFGLILHNQLIGVELIDQQEDYAFIKAYAGEKWDNFVLHCINNGWYGLENLSFIPGNVGAAPIQNIGAYGIEVKDFIDHVEVYDVKSGQFMVLNNRQCQFEYRNSYLKQNRWLIIIAVIFRLFKQPRLNMQYGDIMQRLRKINLPQPLDLRNVIIDIRSNKLPNISELGNVGSFFHNPIVPLEQVQLLQRLYPDLPCYPLGNALVKVSAGWLIDNLGLRGFKKGNVGVYSKQALVLVNYGYATLEHVLDLAKFIQKQVYRHYNIWLTIEPIVVQ